MAEGQTQIAGNKNFNRSLNSFKIFLISHILWQGKHLLASVAGKASPLLIPAEQQPYSSLWHHPCKYKKGWFIAWMYYFSVGSFQFVHLHDSRRMYKRALHFKDTFSRILNCFFLCLTIFEWMFHSSLLNLLVSIWSLFSNSFTNFREKDSNTGFYICKSVSVGQCWKRVLYMLKLIKLEA